MENNTDNNEEKHSFRITNAKVIGLLAAALIFVVSYTINSIINSPHRKIDTLAEELTHVHKELDELKVKIIKTEGYLVECSRRNDDQAGDIKMLMKMGGECVNWRSKAETEINQLSDIYQWYLRKERLPD